MIRTIFAAAVACAMLAAPASAQRGEWRHDASGISLPRSLGEMEVGAVQDASSGGNWDVILQLGNRRTAVTLYVYRSAYPNPALWFERTRLAMNENVGAGGLEAAPRSFTLGGASAPNGLREEIALPGGRATGVAIAQIGEWMVKLRVTSDQLDAAAVGRRMDQVLGALRFARPTPAPVPLVVPQLCPEANAMAGQRITDVDEEAVAAVLPAALTGERHARGSGGLAAEPQSWCRDTTQVPNRYATVYRQRNGNGWVALLADSGRAVSAYLVDVPGRVRATVLASTPAATEIVALYGAMPNPNDGVPAGLPVAAGMARGMISVGPGDPAGTGPGKN